MLVLIYFITAFLNKCIQIFFYIVTPYVYSKYICIITHGDTQISKIRELLKLNRVFQVYDCHIDQILEI